MTISADRGAVAASPPADAPASAIEVHELAKRYEPSGVDAVSDLSFSVAEEEIFGLLGRNGAGKSTTVRILTTLLRPTAGWARVLGIDVVADPVAVRQLLGVALQEAALDELMTGREHLVLAARMVGMTSSGAKARADELLEIFGLTAAADRIAARYSGGMRRRLDVSIALVRNPRVLFLDEPTTGLDPQSRRALWDLIRDLRAKGATVFLTTQYLAEADELADRVSVMHGGQIAAIGSPAELKDRYGATTIRLRLGGSAEAVEALRAEEAGAHTVHVGTDGWVVLSLKGGEDAVPAAVARLTASGAVIERMAVSPPSLEDVFVSLTGTDIQTGAGGSDHGAMSAVRRGMGVPAGGGG